MKVNIYTSLLMALLLVPCSCKEQTPPEGETVSVETTSVDPLPSWNEGKTKEAIMAFVEGVTREGSPTFVPQADRIATFDNDGNLWSEQPFYFQLQFAIDRVRAMASDHPEWKDQQPFKALLEGDMQALMAEGEPGLIKLVMASHAGMTTADFDASVKDWLERARHPRFDQPYNTLVYQPMLELLDYLRDNGFTTFIVSGGGIDFMRPWTEEVYGIPPHQVVGSSIKAEFDYNAGSPVIRKLPELDFIDDKAGKPVGIHKFIGKKPIFASGNSDGDLQMLQYTASNPKGAFMLYLHHTDAEREWAYDRDSHIGRLDKGLDEAREKGWTVIDMKTDWKVVYPFQTVE
ncbi:HAD family hydrolase [Robiginitalea marina]|uniref:Haloacid dehalogenase-like hydrolase n=1 Tax=Robiginitalea marina TaxID=2954105 RepID=A0ABT1AZD3_9FLAO|nr:HAD family hydrolase [Robiginitalea marina]MCO5725403.1 haloacid dehalogenase-like hydrolase [Robiginitalea marina]